MFIRTTIELLNEFSRLVFIIHYIRLYFYLSISYNSPTQKKRSKIEALFLQK